MRHLDFTYVHTLAALLCGLTVMVQGHQGRAAVAVDVDGDGIPDYVVSGADRDGDGIPDALQVMTAPCSSR